ncbi:IclR family transcriptional regulator [Nocardioides sp. BYT-33-1]|uniref:IclR family transcriptional regulator n=1 Tax=Nocardioides sp. BYT-33-1 TaxID=3416952 RepID=UPI003F5357F6
MKNRPSYAIESVDNALLLAQLLLLEGPMRVTDAAERLEVSASTAHRLFAMLVYRDFAEQDADKRYRPGPLLRGSTATAAPLSALREAALPHLRRLVDRTGESVNLVVLTGAEARFVQTVECDRPLRVGDRTGKALPAHVSSGGKAMLAELDEAALAAALADLEPAARARVRRSLRAVRQNGFALNNEQTEAGLTAIGVAVRWAEGMAAGISLAMPTARFSRDRVPGWVKELHGCARAIEKALSSAAERG